MIREKEGEEFMYQDGKIYLGKTGEEKVYILPKMANRHGMVCGATGTGKTVTLKVMAEAFSDAGVPVFLADVKGDLAGMSLPGIQTEDMAQVIAAGITDDTVVLDTRQGEVKGETDGSFTGPQDSLYIYIGGVNTVFGRLFVD